MEIVIASDPDRDDLHAELQINGQPWAEVIYDKTKEAYVVTFVPPAEGEEWPAFDLTTLALPPETTGARTFQVYDGGQLPGLDARGRQGGRRPLAHARTV
ncbi:MAG: hypothetical protein ACREA0_28565 [bacterium]